MEKNEAGAGFGWDMMKSDPPRLVIKWCAAADGSDQFDWGIYKEMPMITLIGAVAEATARLLTGDFMMGECPEPALVIAFEGGQPCYFCSSKIPTTAMVGMLEVVKAVLVASRLAQRTAATVSPILGPDGSAIKKSNR